MDIWSLGCCIIEMTTGRRPWSNLDNEWAVMYHVATGCPPLPEASQLSEQGIDFLQQCFIRSPHKRPSAQELLSHPWITNYIEMCAEEPRYDEEYETYETDYYASPKSPETPAVGSSRIVRSIIGSMPVDGHPEYMSGGTQAQQYFKDLSAAKDELGISSVLQGTDTNNLSPQTNMTGAAAAASTSNQGSLRSEASSLHVSEQSMPSPVRRPSTASVRSEASSRGND